MLLLHMTQSDHFAAVEGFSKAAGICSWLDALSLNTLYRATVNQHPPCRMDGWYMWTEKHFFIAWNQSLS
jgi:hypothetical protein